MRSAIEADEPKVALSWVVSAERRETISPVFSASKKARVETRQMGEEIGAQIGDHPLAERHHEIVARARRDREHGDDADHRQEIDADQADVGLGEAEVDHPPHGHRHDERRRRGDDERDEG